MAVHSMMDLFLISEIQIKVEAWWQKKKKKKFIIALFMYTFNSKEWFAEH